MARNATRAWSPSRRALAQAQTNLSSAWALLLPTIAAQGKYTRNYAEFDSSRQAVRIPMATMDATRRLLIQPLNQLDGAISFNAPLIVPAAYPGLQSVKAGIAAAEANFELSETNVLFAVAQAFYAAADRRRGAGGAQLQHRRRARDAERTPRRAWRRGRSPRSTSIAPSWRWCAPSRWSARRATAASRRTARWRR